MVIFSKLMRGFTLEVMNRKEYYRCPITNERSFKMVKTYLVEKLSLSEREVDIELLKYGVIMGMREIHELKSKTLAILNTDAYSEAYCDDTKRNILNDYNLELRLIESEINKLWLQVRSEEDKLNIREAEVDVAQTLAGFKYK